MRNLVRISIFIFLGVFVIVIAAAFYNHKGNKPQANNKKPVVGIEEIAKHNSPSDCWLIIDNKVYDVSNFLNLHPGNPETIIPYCGKEATNAFMTKDKANPKPHSKKAQDLLEEYYIGTYGGPR